MTQVMFVYVVEQTTVVVSHLRDLETIHLFHGYYLQIVSLMKQAIQR